MAEKICSYCHEPCEIRSESGVFDADGSTGTIKGNLGNLEVSDCCGEPVEDLKMSEMLKKKKIHNFS